MIMMVIVMVMTVTLASGEREEEEETKERESEKKGDWKNEEPAYNETTRCNIAPRCNSEREIVNDDENEDTRRVYNYIYSN